MNFVSISLDDLNAFAFLKSLYSGTLHTPNLDRLMGMGTTFENAYAQVALCNPSRTSVLTGRNPGATGVHSNVGDWYDHVDPASTLPAMLKGAGYFTSVIGKVFHTKDIPDGVTAIVSDYWYTRHHSVDETSGIQDPHPYPQPVTAHSDYVNVGKAIAMLNAAGADPFALFVGLQKPHLGWVVPQEYFDLYPLEQIQLPFNLQDDLSDVPAFMRDIIVSEQTALEGALGWQKALQGYLASLSFADAMVGRLLDTLEANGQLDDTAILLWTDHGYHLGDKDSWHKFTLWEEAARAPFILALPGSADDGQKVGQVVELVDIMPTVLDLMGVAAPGELAGRSLLPFIENPSLQDGGVAVTMMYGSAAIRTNDFRYIRYEDGSTELYDLRVDPNEFYNLAADPAWQVTEDELDQRLRVELARDNWLLIGDGGEGQGGAGNDHLVLAPGVLTAGGGAGDDEYFVNGTDTRIIEDADGGRDKVYTSVSFRLPDNVEDLQGTFRRPDQNLISMTGNDLANVITKAWGQVSGLGGDDRITLWGWNITDGGDGNDIIEGGKAVDYVQGGAGNDWIAGADASDRLNGGTGNDRITGGNGNDTLQGGNGSDVLDGSLGSDVMAGGFGSDTYYVDSVGDQVVELDGPGEDMVRSSISLVLAAGVERLVLGGPGSLSGRGNVLDNKIWGTDTSNLLLGMAGDDELIGRAGNDDLRGHEGADLLQGGAGNDRLDGDEGSDSLSGGADNDVLEGGLGDDTLNGGGGIDHASFASAQAAVTVNLGIGGGQNTGGAGTDSLSAIENLIGTSFDDTLTGSEAANVLEGGAGNDTLQGADGIDTASYASAIGGVTVSLATGSATGAAGTDTLGGFENLTGSAFSDSLTGDGGDNVIVGGAGDDVLAGGGGTDTADYSGGAAVAVNLSLAGAQNTVGAGLDSLSGFENLTGSGFNDRLTGSTLANLLLGGLGNDILDGRTGADVMRGGLGNDTYTVDNAGDVVTEEIAAGTDTVRSSITVTLGANIEALVLTGLGAIGGTGNALDNTITGNAAANIIDGAAGDDRMTGGAGNDLYRVDSAGDTVAELAAEGTDTVESRVTLTLGANLENLTLTGDAVVDGTGNGLANILTGNAMANTLSGGAGNDTLDGGFGADTLRGGTGNDVYVVENALDKALEALDQGTDTVKSSVSFTLGLNVEKLVLTGTAIQGSGNNLANDITGNAEANILNGAVGADRMSGGAGDDTYHVDNAGDLAVEAANAGTDAVRSSVNFTLGLNVEKLYLTGSALRGTGNNLANGLYGNAAANVIDGGLGADAMSGGTGNDTYYVDNVLDKAVEAVNSGTDTVRAAVSFTLGANVEKLYLTGTAIQGSGNNLANDITGNAEGNILNGAVGADTMRGGAGDDTYHVDNAGDLAVEAANAGTDAVRSSVNFTLGLNVEKLYLTGSALRGTGNNLANSLYGNAAANVLDGGLGADALSGGAGNDTYYVDNVLDKVSEAVNAGTDTVRASVSFTLGANVEKLYLTGTAARGTGNSLANEITGNAQANLLDGGIGADTMRGGAGNDTYQVDNAGDQVVEAANAGTDAVRSSINFTLGLNVEKLYLTGSALRGTGNNLANSLYGNAAANVLDGGLGADTLSGGAGDDTYVVDHVGDKAVEALNAGTDTVRASVRFTLGANVEKLYLTGTAIQGVGNSLANEITGNAAANVIDGGLGADTMMGGAGNDTYQVDNAGDQVVEAANAGTDAVRSSVNFTLGLNVEKLYLTGSALRGTGNNLANSLYGNAAANVIDGGLGADTLSGGAGDDTYVVDNVGDKSVEALNAGTDTVRASVSFTLGANVEKLYLTGTAGRGTGNSLANSLYGNVADNVLDGATGADTMSGAAGSDIYVVDNAGDKVVEALNAGTDAVRASIDYMLGAHVEDLILAGTAVTGTGNGLANAITGTSGANILSGGDGADLLDGGLGNDELRGGTGGDDLRGGSGSDIFHCDTALGATLNVDDILDFSVAADSIGLDRSVFRGIGVDGTLAASAFHNGTAAHDADDRILYDKATGHIYYDADGTGAAQAVLFATVTPGVALTSADFIAYP